MVLSVVPWRCSPDPTAPATTRPALGSHGKPLHTGRASQLKEAPEHKAYFQLLEIFAYGSYPDYKGTPLSRRLPASTMLSARCFFGWGGGHALLRQQSHPTEWTVASLICSGSRDAGAHAGDAAETQAPHNRAVGEQKQGRPLVLVLGCVAPGSRRQRGQVCARSCPLAYWRRRQAGVCRRHCLHAYVRGALAGPPGGGSVPGIDVCLRI